MSRAACFSFPVEPPTCVFSVTVGAGCMSLLSGALFQIVVHRFCFLVCWPLTRLNVAFGHVARLKGSTAHIESCIQLKQIFQMAVFNYRFAYPARHYCVQFRLRRVNRQLRLRMLHSLKFQGLALREHLRRN